MKIKTKVVKEEWYLPYDANDELGIEIIEDNIIDNNRWSIIHELIVKIQDKFYKTDYCVGATEYQDEQPWQDDNYVEFTEVKKVQKIVEIWEEV